MRIKFSFHAREKLVERNISEKAVRAVLDNPHALFLDLATGYLVAIGLYVDNPRHQLIVVYEKQNAKKTVITVLDTSKGWSIAKARETKGRWLKIR
jgi:hypothetical protein